MESGTTLCDLTRKSGAFHRGHYGHLPCQLCVRKLVKCTESKVTLCDLTRNVASLLLPLYVFYRGHFDHFLCRQVCVKKVVKRTESRVTHCN